MLNDAIKKLDEIRAKYKEIKCTEPKALPVLREVLEALGEPETLTATASLEENTPIYKIGADFIETLEIRFAKEREKVTEYVREHIELVDKSPDIYRRIEELEAEDRKPQSYANLCQKIHKINKRINDSEQRLAALEAKPCMLATRQDGCLMSWCGMIEKRVGDLKIDVAVLQKRMSPEKSPSVPASVDEENSSCAHAPIKKNCRICHPMVQQRPHQPTDVFEKSVGATDLEKEVAHALSGVASGQFSLDLAREMIEIVRRSRPDVVEVPRKLVQAWIDDPDEDTWVPLEVTLRQALEAKP